MRISLFGEFSLAGPTGTPIALTNRRSRALLDMLGLDPHRLLTREQVTKLLWPGRVVAQAKASLRQCLLELGKTQEQIGYPIVTATREHIALIAPQIRTELDDLTRSLAWGRYEDAICTLLEIGSKPLLDQLNFGELFSQWLGPPRSGATRQAPGLSLCYSLSGAPDHGGSLWSLFAAPLFGVGVVFGARKWRWHIRTGHGRAVAIARGVPRYSARAAIRGGLQRGRSGHSVVDAVRLSHGTVVASNDERRDTHKIIRSCLWLIKTNNARWNYKRTFVGSGQHCVESSFAALTIKLKHRVESGQREAKTQADDLQCNPK